MNEPPAPGATGRSIYGQATEIGGLLFHGFPIPKSLLLLNFPKNNTRSQWIA